MNGTLGIEIFTVPSPIDVMVGIASWSGGVNRKMTAFFDFTGLGHQDVYRFVAVDPSVDLKIKA